MYTQPNVASDWVEGSEFGAEERLRRGVWVHGWVGGLVCSIRLRVLALVPMTEWVDILCGCVGE